MVTINQKPTIDTQKASRKEPKHATKQNHQTTIRETKRIRKEQGITTKQLKGASLVAQWLRICLLMQGTRVRALVWEDPTCHGAAGPVSHNY